MSVATVPTTTVPTTTVPATFRARDEDASVRSLLRVGASAAVAAAVTAELFTLAARTAGVSMRAADPGAASAKLIPVGGIFMAVLMNAAGGLLVAVALRKWAKAPAKTFAVLATIYAVLSLLGPIFAAHTHAATKLVLLVAHVIAAAGIIPVVTATLPGATRRARS